MDDELEQLLAIIAQMKAGSVDEVKAGQKRNEQYGKWRRKFEGKNRNRVGKQQRKEVLDKFKEELKCMQAWHKQENVWEENPRCKSGS